MMTEGQASNGAPPILTDERMMPWMEEHLPQLKRSVAGNRFLYGSLIIGFVVGLAAHVGGYVLLSSAPREPFGLLAELLYALGLSLWTGVVVAVFVQVIPEVKRRQIRQAIQEYEALRRDRDQAGANREGAAVDNSPAARAEKEQEQD